jgi:hypothetical protein
MYLFKRSVVSSIHDSKDAVGTTKMAVVTVRDRRVGSLDLWSVLLD